MADPNVAPSSDPSSPKATRDQAPTPLRCLTGALISAPMTLGLYVLTSSIAQTFAEKPLASSNALAVKISVLVRTLVVGVGAMGTGIFGITTLGLLALGLQLLLKNRSAASSQGDS